jgi:uncharacterized protein (TIGR04255 family)
VTRKVLKKKPLVEAIFELRWDLQEPAPGVKIDPHYKIVIGRIYDKVNDEYSFHEQLPTASVPDEMIGYVVQHRFRKDKDQWPLVQIGPGIITVNDTEGYIWEDFEQRIIRAVNVLFEVYPDSQNNLKINNLLLRYIDAIDFDFESNVFEFLREKMKIGISLYPKLFEATGVEDLPLGFDWRFTFSCSKPNGLVHLRFVRGKRKEADALIWETMVQSVSQDVPDKIQETIQEWLAEAHNLTDDWFFKLIEGELLRRFE